MRVSFFRNRTQEIWFHYYGSLFELLKVQTKLYTKVSQALLCVFYTKSNKHIMQERNLLLRAIHATLRPPKKSGTQLALAHVQRL